MAFSHYLAAVVNLLYPMHCSGCWKSLHNEDSKYLCNNCWHGIHYITGTRCPRCGMGLGDYALASREGCTECRTKNFRFDAAFSAVYYEDTVKELIHQFKYKRQEFLAEPLSEILIRYAKKTGLSQLDINLVVAVPLHRRKCAERGFNQAERLGRKIGRFLDTDICTGDLKRTRNTASQTSLPYYRREENVRGAFWAKRPAVFQDKNILLVDDVFTSGLTASECAGILKKAGARKVYVLTVAKSRRTMAGA
ncbi:MAG: ComF family protein [Candidatus Brocadiales bacterium]